MGQRNVWRPRGPEEGRQVATAILRDIEALDRMLADGLIESGVTRIGAEQEMFLVGASGAPVPAGPAVLSACDDDRITSELGAFNLEANVPPMAWSASALSELEQGLRDALAAVTPLAEAEGARILLCGILPTLRPEDLVRENMTPAARYHDLDDALREARGGSYRVFIKGADELSVEQDSAMLEASNTSFQLHLQVDPDDFANVYNLALLTAAPLLGAAVNSPLLFGRRLWHETRIALFQQSVDTRPSSGGHRRYSPRVHFGERWVDASVTELFKEDIGRYRPLLATDPGDDPRTVLGSGGRPPLTNLQVFNGTVYRWVRPCYGTDGQTAHIRIENRVLPAGPTVVDEVANAAFWYGLMAGMAAAHPEIAREVSFDVARGNFTAAARLGLGAPLEWFGRERSAGELILGDLLRIAADGLDHLGTDPADRDRYLGLLQHRVASGQTGAAWQLRSLAALHSTGREAMVALTETMYMSQSTSTPVHEWALAPVHLPDRASRMDGRVGGFMSTDLVTVRPDDPVGLAIRLMEWRRVRHVPVEDQESRLCGMLTRGDLFRALASQERELLDGRPVSELMVSEPITAAPADTLATALSRMRHHTVSALPVVIDGRLVGLVTERDFLRLAGELLTRHTQEDST